MNFNHLLKGIATLAPEEPILKKGDQADTSLIKAAQVLLYSLGYGGLLNWDKYRADGDYGGGTSRALSKFLSDNGKDGNGETLNAGILSLMEERYALLPGLRKLKHNLDNNSLAEYYSSEDSTGELQALTAASGVTLQASAPTREEAESILNTMSLWYGEGWQTSALPSDKTQGHDITSVSIGGSSLKISDSWVSMRVKKHKKGVFTVGKNKPSSFLSKESTKKSLEEKNYSESAIRVITPVSKHEGNLDAINTWDNSYISLGMFQWTLGVGSNPGEIAALLKRVKEDSPNAFEECYARFGLDVAEGCSYTKGFLTLDGEKLKSPAAKEKLRTNKWAFRFWKSSQDPRVQLCEVIHALDRVRSFYHHDDYRPAGKFYIDQLVTSEYGVALLLDHHVNRPGHLMNYAIGKNDIVGRALKNAGLENSDPSAWTTAEERRLIEAYLPLRFSSSMTHGQDRANKIKAALDRGELSAERNSFSLEIMKSRSLPSQADFPTIDFAEYESRGVMMVE